MIYITLCMEEMNGVKLYNTFPMKTSNIPMHMELSMTTMNQIFPRYRHTTSNRRNPNPITSLDKELGLVDPDHGLFEVLYPALLPDIYSDERTGQCFHRMMFNHSHPNMIKNGYKIHGMTTNGVELSIRFISNDHAIHPRKCQNQVQCNLAYLGYENQFNHLQQNQQTIQALTTAEKVENGLWKGRNKGQDSLYYEGIIPPPDERNGSVEVIQQRSEQRTHFYNDIGRGRPITVVPVC